MKKILALILTVLMILSAFSGCRYYPHIEDGKYRVVTTVFPIYDWVHQIIGDGSSAVRLSMLLDNGVDLHSYQPSTDDMVEISTCDVFIYVGGESDKWVDNALKSAVNQNKIVINLLDVLGESAKEEELVSGMEAGSEDEEDGEDEDKPEYDEHIWLSLKNASVLCQYISDRLCELCPSNSDAFIKNTKAYREKLNALDSQYESAVYSTTVKTLLFGDRFPFRYLTDDYGLDYYAAFSGCSSETEASFETIVFLAHKVDELHLNSIMCIEGSNSSIASTIRDNTTTKDQKILTLNSMQSTTAEDVENGVTYLSVMEKNLDVLKEALQ